MGTSPQSLDSGGGDEGLRQRPHGMVETFFDGGSDEDAQCVKLRF